MNHIRVRRGIPGRKPTTRLAAWSVRPASPPPAASRQGRGRAALSVVAFAAAYLVAGEASGLLMSHGSTPGGPVPTSLAVPGALLVCALLLAPPRRWWRYLLAALPVHLWVALSLHQPLPLALAGYLANALLGVGTAGLMRRWLAAPLRLTRVREVAVFVACAAAGALPSATLGAAAQHIFLAQAYRSAWPAWYLAEVLALLVLVPALVPPAAAEPRRLRGIARERAAEAGLLALALLVAGGLMFGGGLLGSADPDALIYLPVPVLLWAAVRFGVGGSAGALALVALVAIAGTAGSMGPFVEGPVSQNLLVLQLFLTVIGVPLLFLGALVQERQRAQDDLARSEARHRAYFELNGVGAAEIDLDTGRFVRVNDAFCRATGYSREELLRLRFSDITHPEDREENLRVFRAFRRQAPGAGASLTFEKRYVRHDGQTIWVQIDATLMRDGVGRPLHVVTVVQDVTARRRAEEASAHLAAIVTSADDAIVSKTLDGIVTTWNAGAERMFGYTASEMMGQPILRLIPPDRHDEEGRILARLRAGERIAHFETVRVTKDRRPLEVSLTISPIRDGAGTIIGGSKIARDISGRKELERRLRASGARYRDLVETQTEMVCRYLPDSTLTFVNDAYCRYQDRPREQLLGTRFIEHLPPAARGPMQDVIRSLLLHPGVVVTEMEAVLPSGSTAWQQWVDRAIVDADGKVVELQGIGRDITERKRAEEALRASEERFRTMADTAPVLIWVSDAEALISFVNAPWLRFTGRTLDQELGNGWAEGVHPDDYEWCLETYLDAFRAHQDFTMEYRLRRHDGAYRWILDSGVPTFDPSGGFLGYIGSAVDITERKVMEQRLQASEARFRAAFESAGIGMALADLDGRITRANLPLVEMLGYPEEELRTLTFDQLTHPDDVGANLSLYRRALAGEIPGYQMEKRYLHKGGRVIWARVSVGIVRDEGGRPLYLVGQLEDITARKRAEEALRASGARYRAVVETQTEMVCRYLPDSTLTFVNDAYCRYQGRPREQLLGTRFIDLVPPSARVRVRETVQSLLAHPGIITIEHEYVLDDGSQRWQEWVNRTIVDADGKVVELQGIGRDITGRKRAEKALEELTARLLAVQDDERRRLARDLHDGAAQTIAALGLNLTNLRAASRGAIRDRDRFERILADSQQLAGQALRETRTLAYVLHPPQLDEGGLVPALEWYVKGFSQRSGIRVALEANRHLGRLPEEVERVLYRVVQECLVNIHRHSGSPSARVLLSHRRGTVRLLVADRGGGMGGTAPDGRSEEAGDVLTLGVGLPGMRQRVRQLGGWLRIRSSGRGTIVVAVVPAPGAAKADATHASTGQGVGRRG